MQHLRACQISEELPMLSILHRKLGNEVSDLKPGDWVIQNEANSGVGRSLIAIAKAPGLTEVPGEGEDHGDGRQHDRKHDRDRVDQDLLVGGGDGAVGIKNVH